jgi:hypothetical protein
MTAATLTERQLRLAVSAALRAPSVHNIQPWRFTIRRDGLDIHADTSRRLRVIDPTARQMWLSVGCALFNARVWFAANQLPVTVQRFPDGTVSDLAARITVGPAGATEDELSQLGPLIDLRQTNRRQFADDALPEAVLDALVVSAVKESSLLRVVRDEAERQTLGRLSQAADAAQIVDPRYRAELRAWTTTDTARLDGVRAAVVPHVDGSAQDDMPIRDFDTSGSGWLPASTTPNKHQSLLVLGTDSDGPPSWLRAGEALERIWLEITQIGYVASLFTQVIEVPALRAQLREQLRLMMQPAVVIRVGRAPWTAPSLRRHVADVIDDAASDQRSRGPADV